MATIWIVSEDPRMAATLEPPLRCLGQTASGAPERGAWHSASEPDLVVLVGRENDPEGTRAAERLLAFVAGIHRIRRTPVPILYAEPPGGQPPGRLVQELVDDRPCRAISWPPDPDRLVDAARELMMESERPASIRDRVRTDWVRRRVELLYAGIELPALRRAVDPRNAAHPVLLIGEPGTYRALLGRYIHQLAEPVRRRFVRILAAELPLGQLEQQVLERSARSHATVYLDRIDHGSDSLQEELAELLTDSGAAAIEGLRWIASADSERRMVRNLREAPWIRVDLPPLRERGDLAELAGALAAEIANQRGREIGLSPGALALLERYGWPRNLVELEAVLRTSIQGMKGDVLDAVDLQLDARVSSVSFDAAQGPPTGPSSEPFPSREGECGIPGGGRAETAEPPTSETEKPAAGEVDARDVLAPLVEDLRGPLLALRTYAGLATQRPADDAVLRRLTSLLEQDVRRLEAILDRVGRFASLGPPQPGPVDIAATLASALRARRQEVRDRSLVVLEELDHLAPPARADGEQLRFLMEALLDRVLRMVPPAGDLYVGHRFLEATEGQPARHRILIRFHSPEEVLMPPKEAGAGGVPVEVTLARALLARVGGRLSVDASGPHDNLVLIELPR